MSTRANIIIKDEQFGGSELIFYRHSDGYPKGTLPTLKQFMQYVVTGRLRDNVEQSAGWLILIGARENNTIYLNGKDVLKTDLTVPDNRDKSMGWNCGSYEPSCGIHSDIEFLYTLNLTKKTITVQEVIEDEKYKTIEVIDCKKV